MGLGPVAPKHLDPAERRIRDAEVRVRWFLREVGVNSHPQVEVRDSDPAHLTLATIIDGVTWLFGFGLAGETLSFSGDEDIYASIGATELPDLVAPPTDADFIQRARRYKREGGSESGLEECMATVRQYRSTLPELLGGTRMAEAREKMIVQRGRYFDELRKLAGN
jgi:hypothetical protein